MALAATKEKRMRRGRIEVGVPDGLDWVIVRRRTPPAYRPLLPRYHRLPPHPLQPAGTEVLAWRDPETAAYHLGYTTGDREVHVLAGPIASVERLVEAADPIRIPQATREALWADAVLIPSLSAEHAVRIRAVRDLLTAVVGFGVRSAFAADLAAIGAETADPYPVTVLVDRPCLATAARAVAAAGYTVLGYEAGGLTVARTGRPALPPRSP